MSLLGSIADLFTGGLAGGITGIIGSISSAFVNYKMKKLEYTHEETMFENKLKYIDAKAKAQIQVTEAEVEGEINKAEQEARKESYKELKNQYFRPSYFDSLPNWSRPIVALLFAFLDFIRGIIRPLTTIFITCLVTWIGYSTYVSDSTAFVSSAKLLVQVILYLAVMIYSWWYCDRKIEKYLFNEVKNA